MRKLILFLLSIVVFSCVPKNQYNAVNAELNYYRDQAARVDSLESQAAISTYNNNSSVDLETQRLIREVENLKATNISLNQSFQDLSKRFDEQVQKNIELTQTTGDQVTNLQQNLADRKAEVSRQEQLLKAKEIELYEREQELAAISPEIYGQLDDQPATYGSGNSTPLAPNQQQAVRQNQLQTELRQTLGNYPYTDVRYGSQSGDDVTLTLSENILFSDGFSLRPEGQQLVSRIGQVLHRYPDAQIRVVGHNDMVADPVIALENSTDRAIAVTQVLVAHGVNPAKVLTAGQGFYKPITNDNSANGRATNRRTDIIIVLP